VIELNTAESIADIISEWLRRGIIVEDHGEQILLRFINPLMTRKYGEKLVFKPGAIVLLPPIILLDESILRLKQFYRLIAGFIGEAKFADLRIVVDDCDEDAQRVLSTYLKLRESLLKDMDREKILELSIALNELSKYSSRIREMKGKTLSDGEYMEYQLLLDRVNKYISKCINMVGSEEKLVEALRITKEAQYTEIALGGYWEPVLVEILGIDIRERASLGRLSNILGECRREYIDIYKHLVTMLRHSGRQAYLVMPSEYSFMKNIPGLEGYVIVVESI